MSALWHLTENILHDVSYPRHRSAHIDEDYGTGLYNLKDEPRLTDRFRTGGHRGRSEREMQAVRICV